MTQGSHTLLFNINIATFDAKNWIVENGAVIIEDGRVKKIGPSDALRKEYTGSPESIRDGGGRLLIPGFINAHAHLYGCFARGMAVPGKPPRNFLQILQRLWWKVDKALDTEAVFWSAAAGLVQALRRGTTTVIDHHASPNAVAGSLEALALAFTQAGVRGGLCYEVSDRDGADVATEGIMENIRFFERCRKDDAGGMLRPLFGLHASFTISNKTLLACGEIGADNRAGFHVHCAEDDCDNTISRARFKARPLKRFARAGILNEKTILAHCIHIDAGDRAIIRDHNCLVAHNPRSNMNNAVGVADIKALLDAGITVGLGTDGISFSQQEEILAAFLLHKIHRGDSNFGWGEIPQIAIRGNQEFARRIFGQRLGVIAPGAPADLVLLDYFPPTPLTPDNVAGHLFFGMLYAPVFATIINGVPRLWNHELVGLDEAAIAAEAAKAARRVWKRIHA